MNRGADARVGGAAAKIAGHRRVNVGICRFGFVGQQCRGAHELARLAVAALRHVHIAPRLLQRRQLPVLGQALDGRDLRRAHIGYLRLAGTLGLPINVHRARAAHSDAAAILRADHFQTVAQHPQEWRIRFDID